ncbi:MAG: TIGR03936 family radical SAM-associated protein [Clostridiales bacterium]|nr:TIGR03936 family radical SAM-associated protein [Clostridiales bacterium]
MKIFTAISKGQAAAYTSHLDFQRVLQQAARRAKLPLAYSQGFSPHPLFAFATALATGYSSDGEWVEMELIEDLSPKDFIKRLNAQLPPGLRAVQAMVAPLTAKSLASGMEAALYGIVLDCNASIAEDAVRAAFAGILADTEILHEKKGKGGLSMVNIRPQILELRLLAVSGSTVFLRAKGVLTAAGGLRPEFLVKTVLERLQVNGTARVHRERICFSRDSAVF